MPFTGKSFDALTEERLALKKLVEKYEFELTEQFIGYQFKEDFEVTKDYSPSWVLGKDKNWLKQSDVVISDFTSPSLGTDCELVLAKEIFDKAVYAVVPQEKRSHPWLRFYCNSFYDSVEDALKQIKVDYADGFRPPAVDKRQYDAIAAEYRLVEETPAQEFIYDPTLRESLARHEATGKRIVVLHAASGHRARLAKQAGAGSVLGIDLSHREIRLAEDIEVDQPLGIHYLKLDPYLTDFIESVPERFVGETDIVIGYFLLDHAMNRTELNRIAQNVSLLLKPGGVFIGMSDHPSALVPTPAKYGVVLSFDEKNDAHREGEPRRISIFQKGKEVTHFHNFLWSLASIQNALQSAGLTVTTSDARISQTGIAALGEVFWKEYNEYPTTLIIEGRKNQ